MNLYSEELNFAPWKHIALHNFVADLITEHSEADVFVIAIDGRSGGGKSTMASILAGFLTDARVIHTDDIAWHHSFFDWQ
ncbi:MAG: hypothetical protein AAF708_17560, partial [Deinococcota bacterium]